METTAEKNKALELIHKHAKFQTYTIGFEVNGNSEFTRLERARQSALITANEILEAQPSYEYWEAYDDETPSAITFWNGVKDELEKFNVMDLILKN